MFSHRFVKKKTIFQIIRKAAPLAVTLAVLAGFYMSVLSLSGTASEEQKKNLESTLRRGIMQCYALEGAYPESLDYLLNNYPVYYDKDSFLIDYQIIGQNIYPSVSVIPRKR